VHARTWGPAAPRHTASRGPPAAGLQLDATVQRPALCVHKLQRVGVGGGVKAAAVGELHLVPLRHEDQNSRLTPGAAAAAVMPVAASKSAAMAALLTVPRLRKKSRSGCAAASSRAMSLGATSSLVCQLPAPDHRAKGNDEQSELAK